MAAADRRCLAEREAAFRCELAATIRLVSPFLASMVAIEGMTLDDVTMRISAASGWPNRPRLSNAVEGLGNMPHALRHAAAVRSTGGPYRQFATLHGFGFPLRAGGLAHVHVLAHSLEIAATIGPLWFETRFGELRLTFRGGLPSALAEDALGRPLDDFVLHPATRGREWLVCAVETEATDTVLVVVTGSLPLRSA